MPRYIGSCRRLRDDGIMPFIKEQGTIYYDEEAAKYVLNEPAYAQTDYGDISDELGKRLNIYKEDVDTILHALQDLLTDYLTLTDSSRNISVRLLPDIDIRCSYVPEHIVDYGGDYEVKCESLEISCECTPEYIAGVNKQFRDAELRKLIAREAMENVRKKEYKEPKRTQRKKEKNRLTRSYTHA